MNFMDPEVAADGSTLLNWHLEALRCQRPVDDLVIVDEQPLMARRVEEDVHERCPACPVGGWLPQDSPGPGWEKRFSRTASV